LPANIYKNKDGKRVPGVTTVIGGNLGWSKDALMYWAWSQGVDGHDFRESRDKAADIGTMAHAMVEAYVKNLCLDDDMVKDHQISWLDLVDTSNATEDMIKQARNAYDAFQQWADVMKFEPLQSEHLLVSEEYQFGGQIDIAAVQSKRSIIDIKTSNAVYADHKIQIAAYGQLWNEHYPREPIEAYYILQLGKDGSFTYYYYPDLSEHFRAFTLLRELHDLKKKL
jgi:hypothetical protein